MTRIVLLDTGVLGLATHPKASVNEPLLQWFKRLLRNGQRLLVPEIADYELRRELLRMSAKRSVNTLNGLGIALGYLPLDTYTMHRAAKLWANARREGRPLAHQHALDGDVILCAQALSFAEFNEGSNVVVATNNVGHLNQFVEADIWQNI